MTAKILLTEECNAEWLMISCIKTRKSIECGLSTGLFCSVQHNGVDSLVALLSIGRRLNLLKTIEGLFLKVPVFMLLLWNTQGDSSRHMDT